MPIQNVKVTVNGSEYTLTDNGDGTFSGNLAAPNVTSYNVNSGHYYPVVVTATNAAGTSTSVDDNDPNFGSLLRLRVKEITAPTITISKPTSNQYLATSSPQIAFKLLDESNGSGIAIATLQFTLDNVTYTNTSSGVTVTPITNGYDVVFTPPTALDDGTHVLTVKVSDNDGNAATSASVTFHTDTVAPTLSITNPATSGGYTAESSLTVTGTAADSGSGSPTITMTLNGTNVGSVTVSGGTFSKTVTLKDGTNTIVVTATDLAGKTTTITRTIILDSSAPVIASVVITPNPVNVGANYTITISVE